MADAAAPLNAVAARRAQARPQGRARAHSRMVRFLRVALPAVMIGVIVALAALVGAHAIRREASGRQDASTPIQMVNPHFFGRDNSGRAYTLGASQAARDDQEFQKVLLRFPSLTLDVGGPHPSTLTADEGVYREDTRILLLKGHVRGNDAKTASLATDQAIVNTRTGVVTGRSPLASQTRVGQLNSKSFDVYDKGDRMVFKGGVHARLNSK
ncbi:MAG TPA: LPS export ABC transporter periplasmic protein LptC [Caulobacteraceae bacterium]